MSEQTVGKDIEAQLLEKIREMSLRRQIRWSHAGFIEESYYAEVRTPTNHLELYLEREYGSQLPFLDIRCHDGMKNDVLYSNSGIRLGELLQTVYHIVLSQRPDQRPTLEVPANAQQPGDALSVLELFERLHPVRS